MDLQSRKIKQIIEPQFVIEGADVLLKRSFGPNRTNLFDPFLLFDHFAFNDPNEGPIMGFPTHPHRGIETVTYMLEGNVRHRDSIGNLGTIGPGDVQWMTSGRGILHEEMPTRSPESRVVGFQLWVNLPAAHKMDRPRYQEVNAKDVANYSGKGIKVRVVAGDYEGVKGPVKDITIQPLYIDVSLDPDTEFLLPVSEDHFALAYIFEGQGWFGVTGEAQGELIESTRMVVFDEGDQIKIHTGEDSQVRFMLMAGLPIKEPIFPYGPFVMNTQAEIQQALTDLRNGTFVKNDNG